MSIYRAQIIFIDDRHWQGMREDFFFAGLVCPPIPSKYPNLSRLKVGLRRLSQQVHFLDGNPALTSGPKFVTLRPWKGTLSASDSGPTRWRAKRDSVLLQ